jgi:hypothetical protein
MLSVAALVLVAVKKKFKSYWLNVDSKKASGNKNK